MSLSLNSSNMPLFTITDEAHPVSDPIAIPDAASCTPVYDVANSADGNAYGQTANPQAILNNIMAAGVPQSFIDQLGSMAGSF